MELLEGITGFEDSVRKCEGGFGGSWGVQGGPGEVLKGFGAFWGGLGGILRGFWGS